MYYLKYSDKIKKEVLIAAIIAIIAGKLGNIKKLKEILYLFLDYPHKYYVFKYFEV